MKEKCKNIVFDMVVILSIVIIAVIFIELEVRAYDYFTRPEEKQAKIVKPEKPEKRVRDWNALAIPEDYRPFSEAYKGLDWAEDFMKEVHAHRGTGFAYEPFVLWRHNPYKNKYITFMENGYRLTVPEKTADCKKPKKVFFFGGSTINGDGIIRDEDTIPSIFSKLAADDKLCLEVRNYSQSGFNQGNEYVLLLALLAKGEIPDLVIFYDGSNDATHQVAYGVPHMAYDRFLTIANFTAPKEKKPRIRELLAEYLQANSAIARRVFAAVSPVNAKPEPELVEKLESDPAVINQRATDVATSFRGKFDVLNRLSKSYDFKVFLVLQPTLFQKDLRSADEEKILTATNTLTPGIGPSIEQLYREVRRVFAENDPCGCLIDLSGILADNPEAMFIDYVHVSPKGNQAIVPKIYDEIRKRNAL